MKKPFPVFCIECKHHTIKEDSTWITYCKHPKVNAKDPWALSNIHIGTSSCREERAKISTFAACGMKGKLWEPI